MSHPDYTSNHPGNANLYPQEYDYRAPDRETPATNVYNPPPQDINYYTPPNYSEPLVNNSGPMYPGQTTPETQQYIERPPPPPAQIAYSIQPSAQNRFLKLSTITICGCCFITFLIIQIIFLLIAININWFTYCYWDFTLTHRDGNFNSLTNDYGTIKGLYDDVCDPKIDKYLNCPDLCDSIKQVRYSGEKLIGLGVTACVLGGVTIILSMFKLRFKTSRKLNWMIYLSAFACAFFFTIGVIVYISESKFNDNFHDVKKSDGYFSSDPDDFSWDAGYGLSITTLCLQWILVFMSKLFTLMIGSN